MENEVMSRIELIEKMVQEGRHSLQRWGWVYLVWGLGHVLGILSCLYLPDDQGKNVFGILMIVCAAITVIGASISEKKNPQAKTSGNQALSAIWGGYSAMLVYLIWFVRNIDQSVWFGVFSVSYAAAFFATGVILKWTPMKLNAGLWILAAVTMRFVSETHALMVFGIAALIGEVGFGIYSMLDERKTKSNV